MASPDIAPLQKVLDDFVQEGKEAVVDIAQKIIHGAAAKGGSNGRLHLAAEKEVEPIHQQLIAQMVKQIVQFSARNGLPLPEVFTATESKFAALNTELVQPIQKVAGTVFRSPERQELLASEMAGVSSRFEQRTTSARRLHELEGPPSLEPSGVTFPLINKTRLAELRELKSRDFDFAKLIRLCDELNTSFNQQCYFATAALTRALLDHVPPIFGKQDFKEVASNYGGQSFKGMMQHLQNASRNVADGHLHQQIRQKESLPTAQQVNCGQQLDALLSEVVRITK